jgi:hypothetical protein
MMADDPDLDCPAHDLLLLGYVAVAWSGFMVGFLAGAATIWALG